ncbi:MAG: hypothetical protein Alpg2KO_14700 [Alphaproteobacteria bacterium]
MTVGGVNLVTLLYFFCYIMYISNIDNVISWGSSRSAFVDKMFGNVYWAVTFRLVSFFWLGFVIVLIHLWFDDY